MYVIHSPRLYDTCTQAQQIKFLTSTPQRAQKHLEVSLRFWLAGIILSLINGFAKANRLANRARVLAASPRTGEKIGSEAERKAALAAVAKERKAVRYQLVIDSLDVWLPATGLGVANLNDGVAGILGCVFSLEGFEVDSMTDLCVRLQAYHLHYGVPLAVECACLGYGKYCKLYEIDLIIGILTSPYGSACILL